VQGAFPHEVLKSLMCFVTYPTITHDVRFSRNLKWSLKSVNTLNFMFCWLCLSIHPWNENKLAALFILSLFRQSCFGHIFSQSSWCTVYITTVPIVVYIQYTSWWWCRAYWGMGLIFHQAKPRWTRRGEKEKNVGGWRKKDSQSSVLDLDLGMRSWAATSLNV